MARQVDLRSDTVTAPGPEMRRAMAEAEVGDDVLGKDPTVGRLEERVAEMLGKEAALFVPSGTMANQISLRRHAPRGSEVIAERGSHVVNFESGAASALGGVGFALLDGERGVLDPDDVRAAIRPDVVHVPTTSLVWIENTHNAAGGSVWPVERIDEMAELAHEHGLPIHLDGARIWNAAAATGDSPARIARDVDTVSVCMSKGLGAPVGSLVVGPREWVDGCWVLRKQHGGGMRQSGVLAAAALWGLDHLLDRLPEDHANARFLGERIAALDGIEVDLTATQTNIVVFDIAGTGYDPREFAEACAERGALFVPFGGSLIRAVTHLDVNRADVEACADVVAEVLETRRAGRTTG